MKDEMVDFTGQIYQKIYKLDGVGPVDNTTSTD